MAGATDEEDDDDAEEGSEDEDMYGDEGDDDGGPEPPPKRAKSAGRAGKQAAAWDSGGADGELEELEAELGARRLPPQEPPPRAPRD